MTSLQDIFPVICINGIIGVGNHPSLLHCLCFFTLIVNLILVNHHKEVKWLGAVLCFHSMFHLLILQDVVSLKYTTRITTVPSYSNLPGCTIRGVYTNFVNNNLTYQKGYPQAGKPPAPYPKCPGIVSLAISPNFIVRHP